MPTTNAELEPGVDKVAIFVDAEGAPKHMARQDRSGVWTSKLGDFEDIDHSDLAALEDGEYGKATVFLARPSRRG